LNRAEYWWRVALRRPPSKIVSEAEAPSDQKRAGAVNRFLTAARSPPPLAVRPSVGKYAAVSTPIRALASAMVRSAEAISGRRCRSLEGMSTGTLGTGVSRALTGMEKSDAGLPINVAIACS